MPRLALALVHHPCVNRAGEIYTTSITNLDVHDCARSCLTYDVDAFYIVTPIDAQVDLAKAIIGYWEDEKGKRRNPDRSRAMERVRVVRSLDEAVECEASLLDDVKPKVMVTSAKADEHTLTNKAAREYVEENSTLLVFGTGHGLADEVMDKADSRLVPITGRQVTSSEVYNHLSVRSAVAIILDRLLSQDV
ncbi:MAG: RNA methyltransferase [Deltaproteobacteria bacterium]|nr:RNA methyltransferase [Deltaproteobacteria bacterium]